jgi:riboflavin synthase
LAKFIAIKGSITINGASLTINQVQGNEFALNLIPHTLTMTNLKNLTAGSRVNLEVDLIAHYVERMMIAAVV